MRLVNCASEDTSAIRLELRSSVWSCLRLLMESMSLIELCARLRSINFVREVKGVMSTIPHAASDSAWRFVRLANGVMSR